MGKTSTGDIKMEALVAANEVLSLLNISLQDENKADRIRLETAVIESTEELRLLNIQLIFRNQEKEKRAAELAIANKELLFQNKEKEKRAAELAIANEELLFQNREKEKRAAELIIANKELLFQNQEKEKRAAELAIANEELLFQNREKEKRAAELIIANEELLFQNDEKEKRAAELMFANNELESFAYISSHDLQEPLRKIQTYASRILETEYAALSTQGKDYFNVMMASAKRMRTLIQDLLAYSHTNVTEREFENIHLDTIIAEVQSELAELLAEHKAVFSLGKLCGIYVNVSQFKQVMHNLISNALKFSRKGITPHITIKSSIVDGATLQEKNLFPDAKPFQDKAYCHIIFSDNGIGFDPQYQNKIFEVFQRLHFKNDYAGTGIGLAIVKKIIENHHGIITASGQINEGATFDVYLPIQ